MTRILLADDHQVVILGVRNVLEGVARYHIVGEALNAAELIRKARELAPDIIITDYNMPSEDGYGDGLALVQYLRRNFPRVRILIHTMISSPVIVASLYEEGVSGVLFKSGDLAEMLTALGTLENNQIYRGAPQAGRQPSRRLARCGGSDRAAVAQGTGGAAAFPFRHLGGRHRARHESQRQDGQHPQDRGDAQAGRGNGPRTGHVRRQSRSFQVMAAPASAMGAPAS